MLFFMGAASHLQLPMPRNGLIFWVVALVILAAIEVNALNGTPGKGPSKPLATVSGTLWAGFILSLGLLSLVRDHAVGTPAATGRGGLPARRRRSAQVGREVGDGGRQTGRGGITFVSRLAL